ncbi:hypothetical protein Bbelb_016790 [Branchiostoma belcheri]|nr:hypothetical protein Bbelb_016790 [Branchiostoma belcheri]
MMKLTSPCRTCSLASHVHAQSTPLLLTGLQVSVLEEKLMEIREKISADPDDSQQVEEAENLQLPSAEANQETACRNEDGYQSLGCWRDTHRRAIPYRGRQGQTCVACAHTCVACAHTCVACAHTCVISAKSFLVCARLPASCLPRASSRLHRKSFLVCARIPASCLPRASSRLHRKRFLGDLAARNESSLHGRIRVTPALLKNGRSPIIGDRPFFNRAGVTRILPCSELSLRAARSPRNLFLCRREEARGRHDAGIRAQTRKLFLCRREEALGKHDAGSRAQTRKLFADMTQVYAQATQVCAQATQVCAQATQVCAQATQRQDPLLDGHYSDRQDALNKCYTVARALGMKIFALQNGGWCAGSPDENVNFKVYGPSTQCYIGGEGGPWSNHVYEIIDTDCDTEKSVD